MHTWEGFKCRRENEQSGKAVGGCAFDVGLKSGLVLHMWKGLRREFQKYEK